MLYLKPSEINFSQDSIGSNFNEKSNHHYKTIGDTLDDLLKGECSVNDIPKITVIQKDGKWFSVDNRRLWIFKKIESFGLCSEVPVKTRSYSKIHGKKFTTNNGGISIKVRGFGEGGTYWRTLPTGYFGSDTNTAPKPEHGGRNNRTEYCDRNSPIGFSASEYSPVYSAIGYHSVSSSTKGLKENGPIGNLAGIPPRKTSATDRFLTYSTKNISPVYSTRKNLTEYSDENSSVEYSASDYFSVYNRGNLQTVSSPRKSLEGSGPIEYSAESLPRTTSAIDYTKIYRYHVNATRKDLTVFSDRKSPVEYSVNGYCPVNSARSLPTASSTRMLLEGSDPIEYSAEMLPRKTSVTDQTKAYLTKHRYTVNAAKNDSTVFPDRNSPDEYSVNKYSPVYKARSLQTASPARKSLRGKGPIEHSAEISPRKTSATGHTKTYQTKDRSHVNTARNDSTVFPERNIPLESSANQYSPVKSAWSLQTASSPRKLLEVSDPIEYSAENSPRITSSIDHTKTYLTKDRYTVNAAKNDSTAFPDRNSPDEYSVNEYSPVSNAGSLQKASSSRKCLRGKGPTDYSSEISPRKTSATGHTKTYPAKDRFHVNAAGHDSTVFPYRNSPIENSVNEYSPVHSARSLQTASSPRKLLEGTYPIKYSAENSPRITSATDHTKTYLTKDHYTVNAAKNNSTAFPDRNSPDEYSVKEYSPVYNAGSLQTASSPRKLLEGSDLIEYSAEISSRKTAATGLTKTYPAKDRSHVNAARNDSTVFPERNSPVENSVNEYSPVNSARSLHTASSPRKLFEGSDPIEYSTENGCRGVCKLRLFNTMS